MRHVKSVLVVVILTGLYPSTLIAQENLGRVDFETSCSPAAEARFETGLALLHHMMYEQAHEVFQEAASDDPSCAMAYWGMAMTQLHPLWAPPTDRQLQQGREAVRQAKTLGAESECEQAYISAIGAYFEPAPNRDTHRARLAAWEEAQETLYGAYPDDVDAGAFYALAHLATAPPDDKSFSHQKRAGALLEKLHAEHPNHPGLFHYTIHAYDNPVLAERAVDIARGYDKVAPNVPHALHMPSHIFVRLGMWPEVIEWNRRSADAALQQPVGGHTSMHHAHAMDYMIYAYLQQGRDRKARLVLDELAAVDDYQDHFGSAYAMAAVPARYAIERGAWSEAARLDVPSRDAFPWDTYPQYEAITHFARGLGAARSDDLDAARAAIERLDRLYERTVESGEDYWSVHVDAQRITVAAWIAHADGRHEEALTLMRKAADLEDSVDKHPVTPGAVRPARELLGDLLVRLDRPEKAIEAYRAALEVSPNRFNSLYGIGVAAERAGNPDAAREAYTQLIAVADGTEADRDELSRAETFLAEQ